MLEKIQRPEDGNALDKVRNKHILIDGDIIKYRCAAIAEKTKYLIEDGSGNNVEFPESYKDAVAREKERPTVIWSRKEVQPLEFALQACKTTLDSLLAKLSPSKTSIFFSPDRTFRHSLAVTRTYKGNRVQPKPKYLKEVEEYLVKQHGATYGVNVEADDEIGVALSKDPAGSVSVSIDKDLLQVPGWHYNWVNDTVQQITSKTGDFNFYTQMLTGDTTDNIPGIAGVGPRRALDALSGARSRKELCTRVWGVYRDQFDDSDAARAYFNEQAALLWILREPEYSEQCGGYKCPIDLV